MPLFSGVNICLLICFWVSAALAQSPSKILKQAEKTMGGAAAIRSLRSIQMAGTIVRVSDGASGRFESRSAKPNLLNVSTDLAGFESEVGYNGRSAWSRNSRNGLQTLTGEATLALQARASYTMNLWLNAKAEKSKLVAGGQSAIDGNTANIVVMTTNKGVSVKMYFDAKSGLLIRDEMPGTDGPEVTEYADHRKVGGLFLPYAFRVSAGDQRYEVKIDKIELDQEIARSEFDFPAIAGRPLPDLPALLSELRANEDRVDKILDTYAFTQKQTRRELGKDGVMRELGSETYQLSFYRGYRITRLIEKNGKPLSPSEQGDADKDAAKRVAEIEKLIAKDGQRSSNGPPSARDRRISIAEVLRASNLMNPRRERFRGRDVIVFDFEPNPTFDYKNAQSMVKFFGKTVGVMWIDEKDKQVARIEAVLADNFNVGGGVLAKLRKGASFTLEQERVNDEIWLPSKTDINLSVRVLLVKGIDVNQVIRSYDYKKFETEVKDATVNQVKRP